MQANQKERENRSQVRFLTFMLGSEEFGVDILRVKEILQYETISAVPNMPKFIRGVINLRGSIVPVVDLAAKFGLPDREITKKTSIVMVEATIGDEHLTMGFLVDSVSQVRGFAEEDIEESPNFGTRVNMQYLRGLGKVEKRLVMLLNVDSIFHATEIKEDKPLSSNEMLRTTEAKSARLA